MNCHEVCTLHCTHADLPCPNPIIYVDLASWNVHKNILASDADGKYRSKCLWNRFETFKKDTFSGQQK